MLPTLYQESALEAVRLAALGGLTDEETVEEYFKAVYRTLNQPGARYSLRSLAFQIGLPVVAFSFGALLLVAPQKARSV
ncbi:MAG: hypothetical protein HYW02_08755 [Deltaproteobacteria bacterium]|nr:hypothetical protein [Deltaproteobacteria bacterium]